MEEVLNLSLTANKIKPFLRWAGGKTWFTKYLIKVKNFDYNNYHEAFLGGAATFFYLSPTRNSYLSDLNGELIETYQAIKDDVNGVIEILKEFTNDEKSYYKIRQTTFENNLEKAARFVYLNQTSYNGVHRVNLSGKYNVPYGFRKKDFINKDALNNASKALSNATLFKSDFYGIMENVEERDLIFLDPPYTVSHNENGFIEYNEKIFSLDDQIRLSSMIDQIKDRGAYYILTNAAHLKIDEIFEKGDKKLKLNRANAIGGVKAQRGQTSEFVFTNIDL